jgi:hypothetical protein
MALEALEKTIRIDIPYFEGVNGAVSYVLAKKTEFAHAENARSKTIGSIEKREGQSVTGLRSNNATFISTANYRLSYFVNNSTATLYRISVEKSDTLSISVYDRLPLMEAFLALPSTAPTTRMLSVRDSISIGEVINDTNTNTAGLAASATVYYLNSSDQWIPLSGYGASIFGAKFDDVSTAGCLFLVNGYATNRYIRADGQTVVDSSDGTGHLYNSPKAKKIAYYKDRLYLGNYYRDSIWYKTSILRSSRQSGIISLVNNDTDTTTPTIVTITDNRYFYATDNANRYEVYRGAQKIADLTVGAVDVNSVTAQVTYTPGNTTLLAADEIWVAGTYSGEKLFRWPANPSITGSDVKQYDSFKLSGTDNNDELTMMATVGDVMMIANKNSLSVWNDYILQSIDMGIGAVSSEGYVKNYGALYFLHYTGIYTTTGGAPTPVSQKVQRYIDGATKSGLENCAAGKKGRSVFFCIGDVTLRFADGSVDKVMPDVCLEYNINQSNWFVHTNVQATQFKTNRIETNYDQLQMLTSDDDNSVREFLDPDTTTDVGTHIPMRIDTVDFTLQKEFENVSHPVAVMTEVDRGSQMEAFISIDREQFYRIDGAVKKGVSLLRINNRDGKRGKPAPGHMASLSIRDASDQICKLSRMSLVHIPTLANADTDQ